MAYSLKRAVTEEFRNYVIGRLNAGQTVRQIRLPFAEGGLRGLRPSRGNQLGEPFKFSNELIRDIRAELADIKNTARTIQNTNLNKRPTPSEVGFQFGANYRYVANAKMQRWEVDDRGSFRPVGDQFDWPMSFHDDRLLNMLQIRERFEAQLEDSFGDKLVRRGELPDEDLPYYIQLVEMKIEGVLKSA